MDGIARLRDELPVTELALIDPDAKRLGLVAGVSRRMLAHAGHPARVLATSSVEEGVAGGAGGAVPAAGGRAGGPRRGRDAAAALWLRGAGDDGRGRAGQGAAHGAGGAGDRRRRARRRPPDAWIVDFTNPVGIVTRALLDAGHRVIGLCNVAIGLQRRFAAWLGADPARVSLGHVGLNHLTWERSVLLDGEDVLPALLREHGDELAESLGLRPGLLRRLGVVPSYYLRYFYAHDAVVREQRSKPSRAAEVADMEARLLALYADPAVVTKPELLSERGGAFYSEAAVALIASLLGDRGDTQVVNVRNDGTLPFLGDEAVIEVPAAVTAAGAVPLPVAPVEPLFAGLIAHVSAYETLALDAALHGGADRVRDALLAHPLIGQDETAEELTELLLTANQAHLPWAASR
ncbi:6-phospho-beta-glucosidase [Nonomuraea salmonea]|uniref:family 4 glycosyl hydrolase n=1 Tax=Nonomuraea salmonea TaxID=46181 RepID=UPI003CD09042